MRSRLISARPWLALLALCALFEAPAAFGPDPVRPTGELFLLISLWFGSQWLAPRAGFALRAVLTLCTLVLVLYRVDCIAFWRFMGEPPLLYDQLFMLRHLFVLFSDLWSWQLAAGLAGLVLLIAAIVFVTRRLLRVLRELLEPARRRELLLGGALLWTALAIGSVVGAQGKKAVHFVTPALIDNVRDSHAIYARVQRRIGESPYRGYAALKLKRRPDVYLVFVESYGRVLATHPFLRGSYRVQLGAMQQQLTNAGWSMASAYSRAPIMGGRSWLAEGSVLMGTRVGYEALFRQLIDAIDRVPNLVSFLAAQGYQTVMLAPADRVRRGIESVNYYHYARSLGFDDLDYHGPRFGWGLVPDQYSLEYVSEKVLAQARRPLYFEYHTVSSHAPWEEVPYLATDWRMLGKMNGPPVPASKLNATWLRLQRYVHLQRRFAYMGQVSNAVAAHYAGAEFYDLAVLTQYFARVSGDALVIIIGDHQPPFLAAETRSFATPVHVLSRDPALLEEFTQHGFTRGMWSDPTVSATFAVRHEGLFSLLARTLARCCSPGAQLPDYLPEGALIAP